MTNIAPAPQADSPQGEGTEITVCIEFNPTTGEYRVGKEPAEGEAPETEGAGDTDATKPEPDEEANEQSWLKPAQNIDDALRQARQLLDGSQSKDGMFAGYANKANARLSKRF